MFGAAISGAGEVKLVCSVLEVVVSDEVVVSYVILNKNAPEKQRNAIKENEFENTKVVTEENIQIFKGR